MHCHWLIDSQDSEKYYLICDNIKEPGIPLSEKIKSGYLVEIKILPTEASFHSPEVIFYMGFGMCVLIFWSFFFDLQGKLTK
jgi:hypothetical protein